MLRSLAIPGRDRVMHHWDLLLTDARAATMVSVDEPYGIVDDATIAISGDRIDWLGAANSLPEGQSKTTLSLSGRWLTPALIDCHTHLVFAANRAQEFEQRLAGATYEDIARAGGGIMSTVSSTREADAGSLIEQTTKRLAALQAEGCATVEIKSGYGLDVQTEAKMLEVARALGQQSDLTIINTFLGAHTTPSEFKGQTDDYIKLVCEQALPHAHERGLIDAVDAYCESIAFSTEQIAQVFETAESLSLPVKLHADQLSDSGGAVLAAQFNALSADHLEYTSSAGVKALAEAGSVAVMLPGAFLTLGETKRPPIDLLREYDVPIAVATDCNPGTSPVCSLRTAMALATSLFKLTPEECLAGVTKNAARALGLDDRGTLAAGQRADIAVWDIGHPSELSYWIGFNQLTELVVAGHIM